jgi:hypothetical protein
MINHETHELHENRTIDFFIPFVCFVYFVVDNPPPSFID